MSGIYQSLNGQIIAPDGSVFVGRGIDVLQGADPSVATLQADFPGLNVIRYAIYGTPTANGGFTYPTGAQLAPYVNQLTAAGYVVELEDHTSSDGLNRGGGTGTVFTGQQLSDELAAYTDWGTTFAANPMVWAGTDNEPPITPSVEALANWQLQTEQAFRATGDTAPVLVEPIGWSTATANLGYPQAVASQMTNTVWDLHYYAWTTQGSTDPNFIAQDIAATVTNLQKITDAGGNVMAAFIGETGNSGDGVSVDPNQAAVIQAVETSGIGSTAWAFGITGAADGLTNADGTLSAYGQEVAGYIKANAAAAPPPPVVAVTGQSTPSANDTVIGANDNAAVITDASGHTWTIGASGAALIDGLSAGYTANVARLAYVNGIVWQENSAGNWWQWNGAGWAGGNGIATAPVPITETISLRMSEDAYKGDAQFTVSVDGTQVGGVRTVTALHGQGSQTFDLAGLSAVTHAVSISFINDAYGGSATTDRNLYLDSMAVDGQTKAGTTAQWLHTGTSTLSLGATSVAAAPPTDMLRLNLSGDAYQGDAQFTLSVDGKLIAMPQAVTAVHGSSAWQAFDFAGSFGAGNHTVSVTFTNDLYGGSPTTDRNLYVNGIDVNGTHCGSGVTSLMSSGDTATYTFANAA
ncbi:MAG: hypothetical protein M3Y22_03515 [Pseudomonadota bacterium]|nr:hypothetical protein [Pseudomonadota bacterium]